MADSDKPEMVEDLMRRIGDITRPPVRIFQFVRYFVGSLDRLSASYRYVSHSPEHVAATLHEAATEAEKISDAEGRAVMVQELVSVFLAASERRKREDEWAAIYAADAAEDDDGFAEASAIEAGSRWHPAA